LLGVAAGSLAGDPGPGRGVTGLRAGRRAARLLDHAAALPPAVLHGRHQAPELLRRPRRDLVLVEPPAQLRGAARLRDPPRQPVEVVVIVVGRLRRGSRWRGRERAGTRRGPPPLRLEPRRAVAGAGPLGGAAAAPRGRGRRRREDGGRSRTLRPRARGRRAGPAGRALRGGGGAGRPLPLAAGRPRRPTGRGPRG